MSKVIIFPTDTVYGIGTPIFDIEGIDRIYEIKKRPRTKPLACLCANLEQIDSIAFVDEQAKKLINKFLPGPLTLILNAKDKEEGKEGFYVERRGRGNKGKRKKKKSKINLKI